MTLGAADFVADPVEQGLTEVRLKCSFMAGFERVEALNDLRKRVLHQVLRVERAASPRREPAVRPSLQPREIPGAELVQSRRVASLGPCYQDVRRLDIALWISGGTHRA